MLEQTHKLKKFYDHLGVLCTAAVQISRAESGAVYLKESDEFVMRAGYGYLEDLRAKAKYKPGEGITGWIGEGHIFKADSREEVESHPNHAGKYNRQLCVHPDIDCWSLIGIPMLLGQQVFGILKVENKRQGEDFARFSDEDVQNLEAFVNAIADGIRTNDELLHLLGSLYVFVQIPFKNEFRDVYELGIKETVEGLGMRCEKVDEVSLPIDILRQIYACIQKADIVISEMTDKSPNVFYETGYAHALGKPTILVAQNAGDIPFDLQHFRHIIYSRDRIADLKKELAKTLRSTRRELMTARSSG
jgi:putative methionine-R-sulfoxide reductase with GAF domain